MNSMTDEYFTDTFVLFKTNRDQSSHKATVEIDNKENFQS